jgi:cobalt-zinc-cadmium resistance protein CzcA
MKRQLIIYPLFFLLSIQILAQYPPISLEEAIQTAKENNADLESGQLRVAQQQKLVESGILMPPAQVTFSGEEFDFSNQSGIQSLNIQQNFYLPKSSKIQKKYFQSNTYLAEKQLEMTTQNLEWQVTNAYYQVLYAKQELALKRETLDIFVDFLEVTEAQLEAGETGKIPKLAARSRLGQAQLALDHANEQYQIALTLFNQIIRSDIVYDVAGELPPPSSFSYGPISPNSPHLKVKQAEIGVASAKIQQQEVQLLPQINSGLRLQSVNGQFPFFGYQLGVNVPLFKKSYEGRIEAAEIGVKVKESELRASKNKMEQNISKIRYQLQHSLHVLVYLQEELAPIVAEQKTVNFAAYREGEIGYLEYLDSLEQEVLVKQQLLDALFEFNIMKLELDYWLGQ